MATTVPTSGTYSGVYLYQTGSLSSLGSGVGSALTLLESTLDGLASVLGATALNELLGLVTGLVTVQNTVAANATVTFGSGGMTVAGTSYGESAIDATGASAIEFASGTSTYVLSNTALSSNTLDNALSALEAEFPAASSALATFKNTIDLAGLGGTTVLSGLDLDNSTYAPPCFVRGTRIATPAGDRAVEDLREGDLVLQANGEAAPVVWVGRRRVDTRREAFGSSSLPVRIRAGALGDGLPVRDLRVSGDHAIHLCGVLVPAGLLVEGQAIEYDRVDTVEYFHVELDQHSIILAEGAAVETYLDTGNRRMFANAPVVALPRAFDTVRGLSRDVATCAPLVLDGLALAEIHSHLASIREARALPLAS